jgi:hypothetical protein
MVMNENIAREFNRILISRTDMDNCISFCYALKNEVNQVLQRSLVSSAIISYARPFSENAYHELANSKIKISKLNLTDEEKKLHSCILELRNTVIAHSDYEANPAKALEYRAEGYSTLSRISDPIYEVEKIEFLAPLAEKVRLALQKQLFELSNKLAEQNQE